MPFCPTCTSEFRAGFERCEECDVALVAELPVPPPRPPVPNPSRRPIYSTTEVSDALLVGALLEGQGIGARIENQNSALFVFGLTTPACPYVVSVPSGEAGDASGIVKEILETRPAPVRDGRRTRRMWLIATAVLLPGDLLMFQAIEGFGNIMAAGLWSILVLGLLIDLIHRVKETVFSEARILVHFAAGALGSIAFVGLVFPPLQSIWGLAPSSPEYAFLLVGPVEEFAKFLPVLVFFWIRPSWYSKPVSWLVACAAAAGGFGLTETLMKLTSHYRDSYFVVTAVGSGLFHPMLSGMVGFCIAKTHSGRVPAAVAGLVLAAILHGLWNTLVYKELEWICLLAMIFGLWFCLRNLGRLFPSET